MSSHPDTSQLNPTSMRPLRPLGVYHPDESIFPYGDYPENPVYPVKIKLSRPAAPLERIVVGDVFNGAELEGATLILHNTNLALVKRNAEYIKSQLEATTRFAEDIQRKRYQRLQELKEVAKSIKFD